MSVTRPPLTAWLNERRAEIEAALARVLPTPPQSPAVLHDAMRYSLMGGGKRLRPVLTLAAAEAVAEAGGPSYPTGDEPDAVQARRLAMPAACAIEMIHTYSLVHDDLPAMDDDTLRRGRPTSHVQFGEGMAILVGDGLLTEAFALLAREPAGAATKVSLRKLRTIALVAEAAGAVGMVGGQAIDLHAARPHAISPATGAGPAPFDTHTLRDMHARKTGALIRAAAVAGAVMSGATPGAEAAVAAFATDLGLAFQIVDDILDVEGTAADLGKTTGKDAVLGKPTYPALFGLARSKHLARDAVDRARAVLAAAAIGGRLPEIAEWVVERRT
jgi:geranylgeranyl diphosphate synthase, type II